MIAPLDRLRRSLGELELLLEDEHARDLLRQLSTAEAEYFLIQYEYVKRFVHRAIEDLPLITAAGEGLPTLIQLCSQMGKAQKALVKASKPDNIRVIARQVSNLGFKLDDWLDFLTPPTEVSVGLPGEPDVGLPGGPEVGVREEPETTPEAVPAPMPEPTHAPAEAPASASEPMMERPPRYANAALLDQTSGRLLDQHSLLEWGRVVRLRLDIGKLSPESQVSEQKPVPDNLLPKDIYLDVMVTSTHFGVATSAKALEDARPKVAYGRFFLPGDGSPAIAGDSDPADTRDGGKYLNFYLKAPGPPDRVDGGGPAHCRIGYYYRNIPIQSQHLVAHVGQPGGFKIETDFTLSEDLTHLDQLPAGPRISVLTNTNGEGRYQIVLRRPGILPAETDSGETIEVKERNVGDTISQLRKVLAVRAPADKRRSRAMLEEDLRQLAPLGWSLYTQLPGQAPVMFAELFDKPENFVVHVARPTTSSFVLPWGFIYEIPLQSKTTPTFCPLVTKWDETKPLFTGTPRQCPYGPHTENVLCPFGFWGIRYAIEQLSSTDKPVPTISAVPTSDFVVGETQFDVNLEALAIHVRTLRETLSKALPQAKLQEGKDRATIETLLGRELPFVYFYCHGQKVNVSDPNPWLAVGKNETITAPDFIGWVVKWTRSFKKLIWKDVRPLIFINACHSLAIEPETLVSYLDAFVGTGHAAGVIGTEVKVSQQLAMDIAEQFFGYLLSKKHTVDSALRTIRLDYLTAGNLLGLIYTPYCWADLRLA